jgi:hypothetical protein
MVVVPQDTRASSGLFRRTLTGLLLVTLSGLVALLLAEGVLRLFPKLLPEEAQLRLSWEEEDFEQQTRDDPELGFLYPAHRTITHRTNDFTVQIHTDEHGFRNPSPWPAQAHTVLVGDSMGYGYGVREQDSWPRLLEKSLDAGTLINLTLPGLGPEQYYRFLKRFGVPLHPQLVLYCLFPGNDVQDSNHFLQWQASGTKSLLGWEWLQNQGPEHEKSFLKELESESYLMLGMRSVRKNLASRFSSQTVHMPGGDIQFAPSLYEGRMDEFVPSNPGFRAMLTAVEETKALTDEMGAHLLIVIFPSKEEVYLPGLGESFPDMVTPVKRAIMDAGSYDVFDLTDGLRKRASKDLPPLFFEVDGHLNERGNALAAELILEKLNEE